MKNVVKVWNRIMVIVTLFVAIIAFIFAKSQAAKIVIGIILAVRLTLSSLTSISLENNKKWVTLGLLDTIIYFPVVGILYLIWYPRNGEVYL